jgi:predicted nucleic acid-binding Zn ribbon protein
MTAPTLTTAEPTHPCVRCGAPVAIDVGLCERCNPLGLKDSASSQVHGIAFLAIVGAVVILAVVGRLALAGVGPFSASIVGSSPAGEALSVTLTVTNQGQASGQTTCRLTDPALAGLGPSAIVYSPRIDGGQTLSFSARVVEFGSTPRQFVVSCTGP